MGNEFPKFVSAGVLQNSSQAYSALTKVLSNMGIVLCVLVSMHMYSERPDIIIAIVTWISVIPFVDTDVKGIG